MNNNLHSQIRRALAKADGLDLEHLEPHDYAEQTDAVIELYTNQLDSHRTEAIHKAIDRLRAVNIQCTALTGPMWYGQGWKDSITCLEDIADYQAPDDSYPGELQLLRALHLNVRLAARRGDLDHLRQVLNHHEVRAGEGMARVSGETAAMGVRPRRGDEFEQWLKRQRDSAIDYPDACDVADGLLDRYRLHADTDTPLHEHICEGRLAGDCDCMET